MKFQAADVDATERLGTALGKTLPDGATIALCGTLGSGKTRLVQAVAASLGVPRAEVVSPTYVLCREYRGRRTLYHLDAFRIADDDEFLAIGPEEYFDSPGITFVEWADRVADCLPPERIEIRIEVTGRTSRLFQIVAVGACYAPVIEALKLRLAPG